MNNQEILQQLHNIKNNTSDFIKDGDIIYISEYLRVDFQILEYKINEHCNQLGIKYQLTKFQHQASVLVMDIDYTLISFLSSDIPIDSMSEYPPYMECMYALKAEQRIIHSQNLFNEVHKNLNTIDEDMYKSLCEMLNNDDENKKLAVELITNSNRTDKQTKEYIVKLFDNFYVTIITSGNPATLEFITSIEDLHHPSNVEVLNKENNGTDILVQIMKETKKSNQYERKHI
jgi:hypothetical protein